MQIEFLQVTNLEQNQFIQNLQQAFAVTIEREFGDKKANLIPSKEDVLHAMHEEKAESYFIYAEKVQVGGCILIIDKNTNCNILDFLFIHKGMEGKNLGQKIWFAIENRYPQTKRWMTITPHFEVRNIHFYINKCQFKAVEFAHPHYISTTRPIHPILKNEYYFYFEKEMQ